MSEEVGIVEGVKTRASANDAIDFLVTSETCAIYLPGISDVTLCSALPCNNS